MLGIDVGGPFTDYVAYDRETRQSSVAKNASVPGNTGEGILSGLSSFPRFEEVANIRLGTTVAAHPLLERKGATVGFLTTKGFCDVPFIRWGNCKSHHDMRRVKPKPLALRRHCFELDERIDASARVLKPLVRQTKDIPEIKAVGAMLLFSHLNPEHERRLKATFAEEGPDLPVSISYNTSPRWKEYERASTTLADAYIKPVVNEQVRR